MQVELLPLKVVPSASKQLFDVRIRAVRLRLILLLVLLASPTAAEKALIKFQTNYQGKELAFIHTFCFVSGRIADYIWRDRELWEVGVALYDLNGDGEDEMMLEMPFGNATGGRDFFVFQRRNGVWEEIGSNLVWGVWKTSERVDGYLTLFSSEVGLRWDPARNKYWQFCIDRCDEDG